MINFSKMNECQRHVWLELWHRAILPYLLSAGEERTKRMAATTRDEARRHKMRGKNDFAIARINAENGGPEGVRATTEWMHQLYRKIDAGRRSL